MSDIDQLFLGFDIGGTKSAAVVGDDSGRVIGRRQISTGEPQATIEALVAASHSLLQGRAPQAVGVSCGSPLCREQGMIQAPANLPGWVDVPVRAMVRRVWQVPVNLENDADAAALAEWRWGLNQQVDHVVYLTCGTGQGAGLILGGRLHRGASNLAGEIGHVRLLPLGPVGCRKAGSVEGLTSGRALGEIAKLRLGEPHPASSLDAIAREEIDGKAVCEAALGEDVVAVGICLELGDYLGRACAILIDVLNPQRISLGSLALRLGDGFVDCVRRSARSESMPGAWAACQIAPAALGDRVQDLAALAAAMNTNS